jgi:hypothetical protein
VKHLSRRLTYANVMSTIAVFLVLGGATAFAASQLGKNSVGSKQLKSNAVTTAKIKKEAVTATKVKKHSLTGTQINVAKLPTVPSATHAASADSASSLTGLEAIHLVGAAGQPGFLDGSINYPETINGARLQSVGFYKDHEGIVHLEGVALAGKTAIGTTEITPIFQLPPGYRPASGTLRLFVGGTFTTFVAGSSTSLEGVNIEGDVLGEKEKPVLLEGVSFRAES